jgi:hypothetical protein
VSKENASAVISSMFSHWLKLAFFWCHNILTNEMKWHCCQISHSFCIIMPTEGIIALWALYPFTGPIFHTISIHVLQEAQSSKTATSM